MNLTEILTKERNSKYVDIFLYSIYRGSRQLTPTADVFYSRGKEVFRHNPIKSREYELYQKYQKDMYFE